MPSKLPVIKANTTQENIDKMKVIASKNKRSVAKELEYLIERRINEYESENGVIDFKHETEMKMENVLDSWCKMFYEMNLQKVAEKTGKTTNEVWNEYKNKQSERKLNSPDFKLLEKYIEKQISENE